MNRIFLLLLGFSGGVFLAIQGGLNARLGMLLKNPLLASLVATFSSIFFALIFVFINVKTLPITTQLKEIPVYLSTLKSATTHSVPRINHGNKIG